MATPKARPVVIVVGLGPADSSYLTEAAKKALSGDGVLLVRTERHPSAEEILRNGGKSLDHHYETNNSFDEVYQAIVEEVVAAAIANGRVTYAVPGSALVLESTVERLRSDERIALEIIPGMSFLDLCWDRLGIDPVKQHVRLIDATEFAIEAAHDHGPFLVGQVYSKNIASEIKLAVEDGPTTPVVLLKHLGMDDESIHEVAWEDIDRSIELDHLCCLYIPSLGEAVGEELARAIDIVAVLRQKCPWDMEQTHQSLTRHLIEETYELIEAIDELDDEEKEDAASHLEEELGDVLCQVLFHAVLASEEGLFNLSDVARTLSEKLIHRHPHVFGDVTDVDTADAVISRWEQIKQVEKGRTSLMEGIPSALPALSYATKLERKAKSVDLAYDPTGAVTDALLSQAIGQQKPEEDLVGELLLAIARRAAASGVDPEAALRRATFQLKDQFIAAEKKAVASGQTFTELSSQDRQKLFDSVAPVR